MPFDKSVLLVVPDTDLFYAPKEAEAVVNLLGANLLNGKVEIGDLLERVRRVQPHLLIISTHGSHEGILLSDGIVGADLLKPIISTSPVECVYLNTCESLQTAMAIHNVLPTSFVSTIQEIPDKLAYVTMTAFAHHLSQGETYLNAWFKSRSTSDTSFLFLPSVTGKQDRSTMPPKHLQPAVRNNNGEIKDLHEEVSRLSHLVYGNEQWNLPGILPTIAKLQRDCHQIRLLLILLVVLASLLLAVVISQGALP